MKVLRMKIGIDGWLFFFIWLVLLFDIVLLELKIINGCFFLLLDLVIKFFFLYDIN